MARLREWKSGERSRARPIGSSSCAAIAQPRDIASQAWRQLAEIPLGQRLAMVIVGGVVRSTLLVLTMTPSAFRFSRWHR